MEAVDKTLELYLFLRDNQGWFSQIDIADKLKLSFVETGSYLEKLNKHGLVNWVAVGGKYFFVPVPAHGGSHTYLADVIRKRGGKASFEDLGKLTGHGPRTLEGMIKSLQHDKKLGFYKNLNFDIEIPNYETDERI